MVWILAAGTLVGTGFLKGPAEWYEKLLVAVMVGGGLLLFLSVLLDRLKALKSDRYGRIER